MSKLRERMRELWEDRRFELIASAVALLAALFGFLLGHLVGSESPAPIIIQCSVSETEHFAAYGEA